MEQISNAVDTVTGNMGQYQHYPWRHSENSTESMPSQRLTRRPVISANTTPAEIIGTDLIAFTAVIKSYQGAPQDVGWDKYAANITTPGTRDMVKRIMLECRRQGYIYPRVYDGKLYWHRIVMSESESRKKSVDLCTLCERDCVVREDIDSGKGKWAKLRDSRYREPEKCWQSGAQAP